MTGVNRQRGENHDGRAFEIIQGDDLAGIDPRRNAAPAPFASR
jgi:hypothetical protein